VAYFPEDEYTDKNERYIICEIIREKALLLLSDEIPHGIGVYMQRMFSEGDITHIICDIIVEKDSHKPIVIGAGGEMLRAIGEAARKDIERLLDGKVYLETFVKVRDKWRDDKSVLTEIGYDLKSIK
jgi:GTP-binding protein Era